MKKSRVQLLVPPAPLTRNIDVGVDAFFSVCTRRLELGQERVLQQEQTERAAQVP
jgi:hypothetical protein